MSKIYFNKFKKFPGKSNQIDFFLETLSKTGRGKKGPGKGNAVPAGVNECIRDVRRFVEGSDVERSQGKGSW